VILLPELVLDWLASCAVTQSAPGCRVFLGVGLGDGLGDLLRECDGLGDGEPDGLGLVAEGLGL